METKKANAPKTLDTEVNKILISISPFLSSQEISIEEPEEISKIMKLIRGETEKCEYFIHSPRMMGFKIELYNNQKMLEGIGVAGDFLHFHKRDGEWYYMQGLGKKLYKMYGKYQFG